MSTLAIILLMISAVLIAYMIGLRDGGDCMYDVILKTLEDRAKELEGKTMEEEQ